MSYDAKPWFSLTLRDGLITRLSLVARIGVTGGTWKSLLETGTSFRIGVAALLSAGTCFSSGFGCDFPADLAVGLGENGFFWSCWLMSQFHMTGVLLLLRWLFLNVEGPLQRLASVPGSIGLAYACCWTLFVASARSCSLFHVGFPDQVTAG